MHDYDYESERKVRMRLAAVACLVLLSTVQVEKVEGSVDQLKCMRMNEERPINSTIGSFRKWAAVELEAFQVSTGTSSTFHFSFSPPDHPFFRIDSRTGDVIVKSRVDRESLLVSSLAETGAQCQTAENSRDYTAPTYTSSSDSTKTCEFQLQVIVAHAKQYRAVTLRICVDDINDNGPTWPTRSIYVTIPEHRGTQYTPLPSAFDADRGDSGKIGYRLHTTYPNFRINVTGNEVYLVSVELDRESAAVAPTGGLTLWLNATDFGNPPRSGSVQLNVSVIDVNDHPPVFPKRLYEVNVTEGLLDVGRPLMVFQASDRDSASVSSLRYSLADDTQSGRSVSSSLFSLHELTGQLILLSPLDFERRSTYRLRVNAFDGVHYADTTLLINVLDENDNAPEITLVAIPSGPAAVDNDARSIRLPENTPHEQAVAFVNVLDLDSGNNSVLTCATEGEGAGAFALRVLSVNKDSKQTSYALILLSALDRESNEQQEIIVLCRDAGSPAKSSSATYLVIVGDVNDNAPQFAVPIYSVLIPENNEANRFITEVSASDADADQNSQITYSIVHSPGTPYANSMVIDAQTGKVYSQHRLDREVANKVGVLLRATDNGTPRRSATAYLEINIEDANDNAPVFVPTNVYEFSVPENEQPGTVIGEVRAIDNDATDRNNQITYQLLRVTAGERQSTHKAISWFVMNERGQLSVNSSIDYEEARSVTLRVEARDNGQPQRSAEATIIIRILDLNDNQPVWLFPNAANKTVNCSFYEPVGSLITYVAAIDNDSGLNGQVLYSLKAEGNAHGSFALNDLTGGLYIAKPLIHVSAYYHLVIEARDRGSPANVQPVVLGVYVTEAQASGHSVRVNSETPLLALFNDQRQVILVFGLVVVTALLALVLVMTVSYLRLRKQRATRFRRRKAANVACDEHEGLDEHLNDSGSGTVNGMLQTERMDDSGVRAAFCSSDVAATATAAVIFSRAEALCKTDLVSEGDLHPIYAYASHRDWDRRTTALPTQPHCSLNAHNCNKSANCTDVSHCRSQVPLTLPASAPAPALASAPGTGTGTAAPIDAGLFSALTADLFDVKNSNSNGSRSCSPRRSKGKAKLGTLRGGSGSSLVNVMSASNGDVRLLCEVGLDAGTPTTVKPVGYLTVHPNTGRARDRALALARARMSVPSQPPNTISRIAARSGTGTGKGESHTYSVVPAPAKSISERLLTPTSPCFNDSLQSGVFRNDSKKRRGNHNNNGSSTNCTVNYFGSNGATNGTGAGTASLNGSETQMHARDSRMNCSDSEAGSVCDELLSQGGATQTYEANSFKPHHIKAQQCPSSYV